MKQILIIAGLILACVTVYGQGSPSNLPANLSSTSISVSPSPSQNYVLTYTYRTAVSIHPTSPKTGEISPVIQYVDGLGRPVETVSVKGSQSGNDIIDHKVYDTYGNLVNEYLPYTKSGNSGAFVTKANFITGQNAFLTGLGYPSADVSKGYTVIEYEKSPLNRVIKQGAPGNSWQLSHPVTTTYRTNTTADDVKTYNYTGDTPSAEYTYAAGKLFVTETTDEDTVIVREFKDIDGKLIQKDVNGAKTRYCYDEFGRLRSVLQPEASNSTDGFATFQYKYDSRGRLTDKKMPRVVWIYYIYDSRDRLVLTQDGVQRAKTTPEWSYTIYDNLNRPIEQGTWATTTSRTTLTTSVNNNLTYMSEQASRVPLKYLYYDVYTSVPVNNKFHSVDGNSLVVQRYTTNTGRQTGEKVKLLDSETGMTIWLSKAIYYDKFGRIIQTVSENHLGFSTVTNQYNFAGEITQTRNRDSISGVSNYFDTYYTLDHRGRLMKTSFKYNGSNETLLSGNSYNEAGNLATQYLHSVSGGAFLQKNDYTYNIRGWMIQMNDPGSFSENDVFGMKLEYNTVTSPAKPKYNGNIASFTWGHASSVYNNMMYVYSYDKNNRLISANFNKAGYNANALDEAFAYDKLGNITKIARWDKDGILIDSIRYTYQGSDISGSYDKQGDVASVVDFPGSITTRSTNYDQNGNETTEGHRYIAISYNLLNLPKQIVWAMSPNKKISYFYTFNGEKLRKTVEDNGTITKVDYCGPFVYETVSGLRSLKYIITPHGRYGNIGGSWGHEYNITDHLGNVRTVIRNIGSLATIQTRHYYSFGMEMSQFNVNGGSTNRYQYNGKELQDDFGLYWYDYGARFYDPMVGRWHTQDPMANYHPEATPYHYCFNNPMRFIDPMGMDTLSVNPDGLPHVDLDEVIVTPDNNNDDDNPSSKTADNTQDNSSEDGNTEQANVYIPTIPWYITTGKVVSTGVLRALGTVSIFLNIPGDTPDYKKVYVPPPADLPGFPGAERVPNKGRARWRAPNGDILEWDYQHGEVEIYDKQGRHKGSKKPDGTDPKPVVPGRKTRK